MYVEHIDFTHAYVLSVTARKLSNRDQPRLIAKMQTILEGLEGSYAKVNEVYASGAVEGYGDPFASSIYNAHIEE